jgi:hypothetical protein
MPDLGAAIRAKLDDWALPGLSWVPVIGLTAPARHEDIVAFQKKAAGLSPTAFDQMRAALLAVLDLHRPEQECHDTVCEDCNGWSGAVARYPCPTVRMIVEKLEIEAPDA